MQVVYILFSRRGAEKKTNILSPRRKVRKGVWCKNKQEHEVLGVLGAFARKRKSINSRQYAKVFGVRIQ
jgi:hypothetical protein